MPELTRREMLALAAGGVAAGTLGVPQLPSESPVSVAVVEEVERAQIPYRPLVRGMFSFRAEDDLPISVNPAPVDPAPISDLAGFIEQRLETELPGRMREARAFCDLKNKLLTGGPEQATLLRETLEKVAGEKQRYYMQEMRRLAALFPDDDPRFHYQKGAYQKKLREFLESKLSGTNDPGKSPLQNVLDQSEKLHALLKRYKISILKDYAGKDVLEDWPLHEHPSYIEHTGMNFAREFGVLPEGFEARSQQLHLELMERVRRITDAAKLNFGDVNALVDAKPFFLSEALERKMRGDSIHDMEGNEPWHYLNDRKLFSRLAMMLGDQADQLDRLEIGKTPENFDYIATKLEPAMQQAFVKAFREEFPEIPVSDIPLPQVHPGVVAWATDAKQGLLSAPPSPSMPLRQEPVAADDAEIADKPPVRIGYSLLNMGRRGLNAILKRKPAATLVTPVPPATQRMVESPAAPAVTLTHEMPGETLKPNPESMLSGLSHREKVEAQKAIDPQAERYRS